MINYQANNYAALNITRGDALMLYGMTRRSYSIRIHIRLDEPVDFDKLRIAVDKTAERYPYFCVTLKKNDKEYYYEKNDAPVVLLQTSRQLTLNSEETNGHIWAVCYEEDHLYIDLYHGRTDGAGTYSLIATLLYYYFAQQDKTLDFAGIRTLDTPITDKEICDPLDSLPFVDIRSFKSPPAPARINLMEAANLQRSREKGVTMKLTIPEQSLIAFSKENDSTPGIMICVLYARAIRRIHPDLPESIVGSYIANARPMLQSPESFHNCVTRVTLEYDARVQKMPLSKQCTVFRGKTFIQTDEDRIQKVMTVSGSAAQTVLDLPDLSTKAQVAEKIIAPANTGLSFTVSYVGKWGFPQLGRHIREFWTETTVGVTPIIEISAVNGQIFLTVMQPFSETIYYDALLEEFKEHGIPFTECGTNLNHTADVIM